MTSKRERIADRITETQIGPARVFVTRTGAKDRVTVVGSVRGGYDALPAHLEEVATVAGELFDAGTSTLTKAEIRSRIDDKGARVSFSTGPDRTQFFITCFPEDLSRMLALTFECLTDAAFPASELKAAKQRLIGEVTEARTDTRKQAAGALWRMLYPKGHVNYPQPTHEEEKGIEAVTRTHLRSFVQVLGQDPIIAVTGDVDEAAVMRAVSRLPFASFKKEGSTPEARPNAKKGTVDEKQVPIKDKANIDTYFGVSVPFTYDDPEYLPFTVLTDMLGGRGLTSGHLMRTIRERDGYTYGIYAQPAGFLEKTEGIFQIWATFSPHNFKEAVAATKKEIATFLKTGITDNALSEKKEEITGGYALGLATSGGLARTLHALAAEGKPLSYIDEYLEKINALSTPELTELAPLIAPERLSMAASGTFI